MKSTKHLKKVLKNSWHGALVFQAWHQITTKNTHLVHERSAFESSYFMEQSNKNSMADVHDRQIRPSSPNEVLSLFSLQLEAPRRETIAYWVPAPQG